jgi:hypothetical protein
MGWKPIRVKDETYNLLNQKKQKISEIIKPISPKNYKLSFNDVIHIAIKNGIKFAYDDIIPIFKQKQRGRKRKNEI